METNKMEKMIQGFWSRTKILFKGLTIAILVLLLLIPTSYVRGLIEEREARQQEAIAEVSGKWALSQTITGPALVVPFLAADSSGRPGHAKHFATILPDELTINSRLVPIEKHRGIYQVMLYASSNQMSGTFQDAGFRKLNLPPQDILWKEAFVKMNVTDIRGLNEELVINWNGQPLSLSPQSTGQGAEKGLVGSVPLSGPDGLKNIRFTATINLNGSGQLLFTPLGKQTTVRLQSAWPHPSFSGNVLPQASQIGSKGFSATWKSLAHTRPFPQQWVDEAYSITERPSDSQLTAIAASSFGADLFVPVNGYQKTMRSVKYAVLCILLTFAAFFLIENSGNRPVHPFHYGLIGLALVLFYTLLLSFSEYIGFNLSYVIAALATVGLIVWFVHGLLASSRRSLILAVVLVLMYTYVFTILQLQDYALLLGSIGLFLTLAVIMHYSKGIQWAGKSRQPQDEASGEEGKWMVNES